jgi:glycosyltransferase involved in cell wall biosynthesis
MRRVCLLAPALQTGDAVGNDVTGMFAALRRRGVEVRVLAQSWTPQVALPVEPIAHYAAGAGEPETLSIYHHATAWPAGLEPFLAAAGPKIVRYHGVTPPSFFAPYCAELLHTTSEGRRQTEMLARSAGIDLFLNDSEHNARELRRLGAPAERCAVVPPFHTLDELASLAADVSVLERYLDDTANLLFVGRLAPNKGHCHLLGVLAAFRRLFGRPLRLLLVGDCDPRLRTYHEELALLARGLRVADAVVTTGHVDAAQLKAYYLLAHAFLVMSEHEGFCVPLVEAMAHRIPIVAYASTAVTETVGDAGLLLHGLDYDHYAAALEVVLTRDPVRRWLRARQASRLEECFGATAVERRFAQALRTWLGEVDGGAPERCGMHPAADGA